MSWATSQVSSQRNAFRDRNRPRSALIAIYSMTFVVIVLAVGNVAAGASTPRTSQSDLNAEAQNPTSAGWSKPIPTGGDSITALTCKSPTFCIGTDYGGDLLYSANPESSWKVSSRNVSDTGGFSSISCPPGTTLCIATGANAGDEGYIYYSVDPSVVSSWMSGDVDGTKFLTSVSCPTGNFCVASDADGHVFTTTDPADGASGWKKWQVDGHNRINAVSCGSASECALVDTAGNIITSVSPKTGKWMTWGSDGVPWTDVSCPSNGADVCFAVGQGGQDASFDLGGGGFVGSSTDSHKLTALSCPATTLCVAGDKVGDGLTNRQPEQKVVYKSMDIDGTNEISVITCPSTSFCIAGDIAGNVIIRTE